MQTLVSATFLVHFWSLCIFAANHFVTLLKIAFWPNNVNFSCFFQAEILVITYIVEPSSKSHKQNQIFSLITSFHQLT